MCLTFVSCCTLLSKRVVYDSDSAPKCVMIFSLSQQGLGFRRDTGTAETVTSARHTSHLLDISPRRQIWGHNMQPRHQINMMTASSSLNASIRSTSWHTSNDKILVGTAGTVHVVARYSAKGTEHTMKLVQHYHPRLHGYGYKAVTKHQETKIRSQGIRRLCGRWQHRASRRHVCGVAFWSPSQSFSEGMSVGRSANKVISPMNAPTATLLPRTQKEAAYAWCLPRSQFLSGFRSAIQKVGNSVFCADTANGTRGASP